jgi:hypothetical protein
MGAVMRAVEPGQEVRTLLASLAGALSISAPDR